MNRQHTAVLISGLCTAVLLTRPAPASTKPSVIENQGLRFRVTDLGPREAAEGTFVTDLNNRGDVVGTRNGRPFLRRPDGRWIRLPGPQWFSGVVAINDRGSVLGDESRRDENGDKVHDRSYIWRDHRVRYFTRSNRSKDADRFRGDALNDADAVAGWVFVGSRVSPYVWQGGKRSALANIPYAPTGFCGINNRRTIVGLMLKHVNANESFMLKKDWPIMRYMEPSDGGVFTANEVNNSDVVVGTTTRDDKPSPCLWKDGRMTKLPLLPNDGGGEAVSINDRGDIVGTGYPSAGPMREFNDHGVIWLGRNRVPLEIRVAYPSGWSVYRVLRINNRRQILGDAYRNGKLHAVLLTPLPN